MQPLSPYDAEMCWFRFHDAETASIFYRSFLADGREESAGDEDNSSDDDDSVTLRQCGRREAQPSMSRING